MFAIELLPAGEGDALVVDFGRRGEARHILIDGGPIRSWSSVRARLLERHDASYEAVVVSHIDEDHIGGILALLGDPDLRGRANVIWFNGYAHCGGNSSVLGPIHGERLTQSIALGGFNWNQGFPNPPTPGTGGPVVVRAGKPLPVVNLSDGARAVLLAPGPSQLQRLGRNWQKVVTAAGLVPGMGTGGRGGHVGKMPNRSPMLPAAVNHEVLTRLAEPRRSDSSAANASSIAFVLEYEGRRLLLTGDAQPKPLLVGLRRYAELVGEQRPRFDLVKLPHHGSGASVTMELLNAIDADRYLVSSSGEGYGHPDDSAIARLILGSARPVTIIGNYASPQMLSWKAHEDEVGLTVALPVSGSGMRVAV